MSDYFVSQEGVYRHDVYGEFKTEKEARDFAIEIMLKESDDYHAFQVNKFKDDYTSGFITIYHRKSLVKDLYRLNKGDTFEVEIYEGPYTNKTLIDKKTMEKV